MDLTIVTIIAGIIVSVVTEILKLIPWFGGTDNRKKVLTFVVSVAVTFWYVTRNVQVSGWGLFGVIFGVLFISYLAYKTVVQPLAEPIRGALGLGK
jgi:Ca2+/Na+ antiporter